MVDGITDEERERFAVKLKAGFVLLVGLSAGLITLQVEAGPTAVLGAVAGGVVVGVVLVWLVFPAREDLKRGDSSQSRRR
jgi:ammonia channel protein AmtB